MTMSSGSRRLVKTIHITASVSWLGAVTSFLILTIVGLNGQDALMVRSAYISTELIALYVIVPLSIASLITGLIQSLGTRWGLFRHYWVLIKFMLTIFSLIVLLIHIQPITLLGSIASERTIVSSDHGLQIQLVVASGGALLIFLVNTTLAVYKPKGITKYGVRKQKVQSSTINT